MPVASGGRDKEVLVDLEQRIEKTGAQVEVGTLPTIERIDADCAQLLGLDLVKL